MSDNVIEFIRFRPVHYTVHLSHDERGFSVQVLDVADDEFIDDVPKEKQLGYGG